MVLVGLLFAVEADLKSPPMRGSVRRWCLLMATVLFGLSLGLALQGQLVVIARELRRRILFYKQEPEVGGGR